MLMKDKFEMSSIGELTFFLVLQVKQKPDGIFISQDKYVVEILRKFRLTDGKSASTLIDTEKPLLKDSDGEDVDVHTYRSMIGSLMFLTSSRLDIMFEVCACARFQVTPKVSHLHAVKRIFRYLKGKLRLGLWYPKDSPYNLVAYLDSDYAGESLDRKSATGGYASKGFDQVVNFLSASVIKCALTVNPNIYLSVIKQFCSSVFVKKVNAVMRLQALIDRKKVIITEEIIQEALHLDDTDSIDCLSNKEIFAKLARMGDKKPSTKITFYKAFFLSQWKFHIHTILRCMSAKRTAWNEFSPSMALAVICLSRGRKFNFSKAQVGNLSSHTTKYSSLSLTQKVFAKMRRVRKGFSRVETPLFEGMIVAQQAGDVADEGDAGVNVNDVPAVDAEPNIPSPTPTTQSPPPSQEREPPFTSYKVEALEQDKVAQAHELIKSKQRVKKLKRKNKLKVSRLRRLKKVRTTQRVKSSEDTVMDDVFKQGEIIANIDADEDVTLEDVAAVAKEVDIEKDVEDDVIEHVKEKGKQDNVVLRYQVLKRKPQTEAQARKNMMIYLKNMAGFKMDYFKCMSYDAIHPIFKKYFNSNVAFLEKTKVQLEEEESRALKRKAESLEEKAAKKQKLDEEVEELRKHLQIVPNDDDDVYTEATPLALKVLVVDYEIYTENNKSYYKIKKAARSYQLYLSFLSLLMNFDREDLEVLWHLVIEIFASSKPKNFLDIFLLTTLTYLFEKPDVQAQI
nr:uncharacterized mitochondrial protein AtMg00810-like [Tanacetum cinerariifolium]